MFAGPLHRTDQKKEGAPMKPDITERISIKPESEQAWLTLRTQDITSTDAAALFGISPYLTPFELWHRKKAGTVVELEASERMRWGSRLQDAIAAGICKDNNWPEYRRKDEYVRWPVTRMGSSFDFEIAVNGDMPLLEIKNVDSLAFKEGWLIDGDSVEAPPHIELQVQHQLAVADRKKAYIGALIGGNRVVLIERDRDDQVIAALLARTKQFWDTIDNNIEPEPDFQKDAEFINRLYRYAHPGKVFNADGNELLQTLAVNYKKAADAAKTLQAEKDGYKAQMLTIIGDAAKVIASGFTISCGLIGPAHVEFDRAGYRDFKVFTKKAKGER